MKKILTLVLVLFFVKVGAQTSVSAVSFCGENFFIRVTFADEFVPVHNTTAVTCPDGSVHYNTEESQYLKCLMELFADAACTIPVPTDPRFFAYCNCITATNGTRIQPTFLNLPDCSAPLPIGSEYKDNWRTDHYLVAMTQCTWNCNSGGYSCTASGPGMPTSFNIIINCCFEPKILAVQLASFEGVRRSGVNILRWGLENGQDFSRLEMARSFDGVRFSSVYSTNDAGVTSYTDRTDSTFYYRLKIYNTNGTFFYSSVVVLKAGAAPFFSISPSPFADILQVSLSVPVKQVSVFKLVSAEGKTMFVAQREVKAGMNHFIFKLPYVSPGLYIMTMTGDDGTVARKVWKQ